MDALLSDHIEFTFYEKRQKAAEVWRNVPHQVFNMENWECGSTACALGWLARENHDGWTHGFKTSRGRVPIAPNGIEGYIGAAKYFGLSVAQAYACFGGTRGTARFHRRWFVSRITPSDVAEHLLSLPYLKEGD
jgi:hypothetical protein